jgi:ribosomal protein S18 acetylase RimI-like enzyme
MAIVQVDSDAQVAAARELFVEYQAWIGLDLCFQGFAEELGGLPGAYAPPSGRLLVAKEGEALLGCVALRALDGERCEMKRLWVRPAAQGRGIGRRLVAAVIAEATLIGYRVMCLDTLPSMEAALALYTSFGFRDIFPYRFNPVPDARYLALHLRGG